MATQAPVRVRKGENTEVFTWTGVATGEVGEAIAFNDFVDRTVQIAGTIGGSTSTWEGSNDGTTYFTLSDPNGVALSFTAAGLKQVVESCLYARPKVTGGAGTVDFIVCARRMQRPK